MYEKKLNIKKVIGAITVFVLAFGIIIGSALITHNARKTESQISKVNEKEVTNKEETTLIEPNNIEPIQKPVEASETNNLEKTEFGIPKHTEDFIYKGMLPKYNENSIQDIKHIYGSDEKQVYLTFDDGPSPNITPQILDILKEEEVPATFFVLGRQVDKYPELVKREFEEGHYIANHGYTHEYPVIYKSVQSVFDEFNRNEESIQKAIGLKDYHTYLFRFPGGSSGGKYNDVKQEAKRQLELNGVASTNWNCLNGDAEGKNRTEEQLIKRLKSTQGKHTSLIILMHDAGDKQATANSLKQVIDEYKKEGYVFKNFYEIFR